MAHDFIIVLRMAHNLKRRKFVSGIFKFNIFGPCFTVEIETVGKEGLM